MTRCVHRMHLSFALLVFSGSVASPVVAPAWCQIRNLPEDAILQQPAGDRDHGDRFGHSVAIYENQRLVVGAPGDDDRGSDAGAVYVFVRREDAWHLEAKIAPESLRAGDAFGTSVALEHSDVLVGAPGDDVIQDENGVQVGVAADRGAAYVFSNASGAWTLQRRFEPRVPAAEPAGAPMPGPGDAFGSAVAFTSPGFITVGAPLTDAATQDVGVVYAFGYNGAVAQRLYIDDALVAAGAPPPARGRFGASLASSWTDFGTVIGQPYTGTTEAGRAHRYGVSGGRFSPFRFYHAATYTAPPEAPNGGKGLGASVAHAGARLIAGAPVGTPSGTPNGLASGVAWSFVPPYQAGDEADVRELAPDSPGSTVGFGTSVALVQDLAFVGTVRSGGPGSLVAGFDRNDSGQWQRSLALTPSSVPTGLDFGAALAANQAFVVVGSPTSVDAPGGYVAVFDVNARDRDGDGLPDRWETSFGLDPASSSGVNGADGDKDGDGITNRDEYTEKTHPTAAPAFTRYFAEGATTWTFATWFYLANPDATATATVQLRFTKPSGFVRTQVITIPPMAMREVSAQNITDMDGAEFSTTIESDVRIAADRAMWWPREPYGGPEVAYGSHAERAVTAPAMAWYFAEGATHSGFNLFYLLQNPAAGAVDVRVRYLRPAGAPIEKTYTLPPQSRSNIWVDTETFDTPSGPATLLDNTDVAAVITALNGTGIIVERALYRDAPGRLFESGHESAGVTAPADDWFFAEGATGDVFDTFILVANPNATPADVCVTYLLEDGRTMTRDITVGATSRANVWVDVESFDEGLTFPLANTTFSTIVQSVNGAPVVAERSQWWPGPTSATWYEAHNSFGSTETGTVWVSAFGAAASYNGDHANTYILIANPGESVATVKLTPLLASGPGTPSLHTISAHSRVTVELFPDTHYPFGAVVESLGSPAPGVVVERATYTTAFGQPTWNAGTAALLTKVR